MPFIEHMPPSISAAVANALMVKFSNRDLDFKKLSPEDFTTIIETVRPKIRELLPPEHLARIRDQVRVVLERVERGIRMIEKGGYRDYREFMTDAENPLALRLHAALDRMDRNLSPVDGDSARNADNEDRQIRVDRHRYFQKVFEEKRALVYQLREWAIDEIIALLNAMETQTAAG